MLSNALRRAGPVASAVEFGPNIGLYLVALRRLLPPVDLAAIEINAKAVQSLRQLDRVEVHHGSIIERHVTRSFELAFCSGVLIHINPDALPAVYDRSEEHTSELQSLMRISYAVFCLKKKNKYHDYKKNTPLHLYN